MQHPKHIGLDIAECDSEAVSNPSRISDYLRNLVDVLDMKPLSTPVVYPFKGEQPCDDGVTGFQIIYTSHVSVHTWSQSRTAYIDVFSCKPFDSERVVEFTRHWFGCQRWWLNNMERVCLTRMVSVLDCSAKPDLRDPTMFCDVMEQG